MRWLVTFLHNDAEYEEVVADESTLAEVFRAAIAEECPAHVIDVEELGDPESGPEEP